MLHHQILPTQYEDVVGDDLVNLAVVLEDQASQESVLASEEFNIANPQLTIQVHNQRIVSPLKVFEGDLSGKSAFTNMGFSFRLQMKTLLKYTGSRLHW